MRGTGAKIQYWGTGIIGNDDSDFGQQGNKVNKPEHDTANKMTPAHDEDTDQPGNPPSQISLRCALNEEPWILGFFMRAMKTDQIGWMPRLI